MSRPQLLLRVYKNWTAGPHRLGKKNNLSNWIYLDFIQLSECLVISHLSDVQMTHILAMTPVYRLSRYTIVLFSLDLDWMKFKIMSTKPSHLDYNWIHLKQRIAEVVLWSALSCDQTTHRLVECDNMFDWQFSLCPAYVYSDIGYISHALCCCIISVDISIRFWRAPSLIPFFKLNCKSKREKSCRFEIAELFEKWRWVLYGDVENLSTLNY